jgi:hypothetical protein
LVQSVLETKWAPRDQIFFRLEGEVPGVDRTSIFVAALGHADDSDTIVDMPNARASSLIRFVLQNQGTLSKNKRRQFPELEDDELARIEETIRSAARRFDTPLAER